MGASLHYAGGSGSGLIYIGHDSGNIVNDVTETTIATVSIPANLVKNQIIITADCVAMGTATYGRFRVKVGALGSEVEKVVLPFQSAATNTTYGIAQAIVYVDDSETWTNTLSVIVTAQMTVAAATNIYSTRLVVVGN